MRPADLARVAQVRADMASGAARLAREAVKMSQGEIASALGVHQSAVSHWESGRSVPSAQHALAYGKLLAKLGKGSA